MKGSLHTDELMAAIVATATGLRTDKRISHVFVMDVPAYPRLLMVTDAAVNIAPDLECKAGICQNAIALAQVLGIAEPKVAILSAVETVTPKIPSTVDAAALCKMADRGQINRRDRWTARVQQRYQRGGVHENLAGRGSRRCLLVGPRVRKHSGEATAIPRRRGGGHRPSVRVIALTSRADSVRSRLTSPRCSNWSRDTRVPRQASGP
jgi:hypothetical protein